MYLKQRAWRQRIHWFRTSSALHHLHAVSTAYSSTIHTTNLLGPHSQKLKAPFEYVGFCADNDFNVFCARISFAVSGSPEFFYPNSPGCLGKPVESMPLADESQK